VWGLNPGDYYVSATTRIDLGGRAGRGAVAAAVGGALGGNVAALFGGPGDDDQRLNYAPTYYPGVGSIAEARPVTVGVSQEVVDVDFNLQLVRTSRVNGRVTNPDGSATTSGNVNLTPDGIALGGGRGALGANYGSRIDWDGSFAINSVPPGRYILRARGDDTEQPQFAAQPLTVGSGDLTDVAVVLRPGGSITGTVTFQSTEKQVPNDLTQIRIAAPALDSANFGPNPNARVEKDGRFTLDGVPAGPHFVRPNGGGALRGWTLKSVLIGGRDVTDTPVEVRSGETLANVAVVFTDALTEVNGTLSDSQSAPVTDVTVLAFSSDPALWRPQSRHITTTRPDQTGKFRIRGLPPGEYYLVAVDPAEQGEWFEPAYLDEHRADAIRITLGEGQTKTQDFRVRR
jgi:hypothetical protein